MVAEGRGRGRLLGEIKTGLGSYVCMYVASGGWMDGWMEGEYGIGIEEFMMRVLILIPDLELNCKPIVLSV